MSKSVYLSVDLDYWYKPGMRKNIDFIESLLSLGRPITVFTEHQLVLRDIKKQYKKVYNIDYHSDITEPDAGWPNCAKWVNYVRGRQDAEFEWRMPSWEDCVTYGHGLCHYRHNEHNRWNPFKDNNLHSWKSVGRAAGLRNLPLDDVDRVSLVLSPEWSIGAYIEDTLSFLLFLEEEGCVEFYGDSVRPLINRMMGRYSPLYNWY
jgi:hypothetical protein